MALTSKDIVPISQARAHLTELADEVVRNHAPKMLTRNGESLVALVSPDDYDELQRWRRAEHLTHLRQIVEAMRELDAGGGIGLDEFSAEAGQLADWVDGPAKASIPKFKAKAAAVDKPAVTAKAIAKKTPRRRA